MSTTVATPTVLPRNALFPELMTRPPHSRYPLPRAKPGRHIGRMKRDFAKEMEQLSDEENEIEALQSQLRTRGSDSIVPLGKLLTQQEERNDNGDDDGDPDGSEISEMEHSLGPRSEMEEENDDSGADLDADMEDMDDQIGDTTVETEDLDEGETEEFDEEPSDI